MWNRSQSRGKIGLVNTSEPDSDFPVINVVICQEIFGRNETYIFFERSKDGQERDDTRQLVPKYGEGGSRPIRAYQGTFREEGIFRQGKNMFQKNNIVKD